MTYLCISTFSKTTKTQVHPGIKPEFVLKILLVDWIALNLPDEEVPPTEHFDSVLVVLVLLTLTNISVFSNFKFQYILKITFRSFFYKY